MNDPLGNAIDEIKYKYQDKISALNRKIRRLKEENIRLKAENEGLKRDCESLELDRDYYRGFSHGGERW